MSIQLPAMLGPEHHFEQFGGGIREGLSPDKGPIGGRGPKKGHWGLPGGLCICICSIALFYCHKCSGCVESQLVQSQMLCKTTVRMCVHLQHSTTRMHVMSDTLSMSDTVLMSTSKEHGEGKEWNGEIARAACWGCRAAVCPMQNCPV